MMNKFIQATTWQGEAFLGTEGGDIWRIWFHHDGLPLLEKLTDAQIRKHRKAIDGLAVNQR